MKKLRRLIQISDLHFGRARGDVVERLLRDERLQSADLICVSGDLTQRAKDKEFEEAARFLGGLKPPKVVVPGNHDVPLWNIYKRFTDPFAGYQTFIGTELEPYHSQPELYVQGLNSARSFTFSGGRIREDSIRRMCERIESLPNPDSTVKVIVSHHPIDVHERFERGPRGRERFVRNPRFKSFKIDLYLFGHLHLAHAVTSGEFEDEPHHSAVMVRAGTTTSTRIRGEANSFNDIILSDESIRVVHYCYSEDSRAFEPRSERSYQKSESGWHGTHVKS